MFWTYIANRLCEHSTQVALGAVIGSVAAGLQGQVTWQTVANVAVGAILPIVLPAK